MIVLSVVEMMAVSSMIVVFGWKKMLLDRSKMAAENCGVCEADTAAASLRPTAAGDTLITSETLLIVIQHNTTDTLPLR